MNVIFQTAMLVAALVVIVAQFIFLLTNKKEYELLNSQMISLERALRIQKNLLIDSERERQWLNNQIDIIWLDIEEGRAPIHPKFRPSYQYDDESPEDPRD